MDAGLFSDRSKKPFSLQSVGSVKVLKRKPKHLQLGGRLQKEGRSTAQGGQTANTRATFPEKGRKAYTKTHEELFFNPGHSGDTMSRPGAYGRRGLCSGILYEIDNRSSAGRDSQCLHGGCT